MGSTGKAASLSSVPRPRVRPHDSGGAAHATPQTRSSRVHKDDLWRNVPSFVPPRSAACARVSAPQRRAPPYSYLIPPLGPYTPPLRPRRALARCKQPRRCCNTLSRARPPSRRLTACEPRPRDAISLGTDHISTNEGKAAQERASSARRSRPARARASAREAPNVDAKRTAARALRRARHKYPS